MAYWYFNKRIAEFRFSQLNSEVELLRSISQKKKKKHLYRGLMQIDTWNTEIDLHRISHSPWASITKKRASPVVKIKQNANSS